MMHMRHDYGYSDHARRREFEERHKHAPIEPLYGPRTTPLWCWSLIGAGMALVGLLARGW